MRTAPIERTPPRLSLALGIAASALAVIVAVTYSMVGGLVALVGLAFTIGGLVSGTRRWVTRGAALLLGGVLYAGLVGAPPVVLLAGVGATVFAWDVGGFAIDLGAQLGREAPTTRLEVTHTVADAAVAIAAAGIGSAVYVTATGGQPMAALLLLLVAGTLLVATLDQS